MVTLASSSKYRAELLAKLKIDFVTQSPNIDETIKTGETPEELVLRLALEKAKEVAKTTANIVIASDQVAVINGKILGKPLTKKNAFLQLKQCSNQRVDFLTSLCVMGNNTETIVEKFSVYFRELTDKQIKNYIEKELPLNCAGSFKSEGLGIALFSKLEGDDPNSLIGLPLIKLVKMLEKNNINVI